MLYCFIQKGGFVLPSLSVRSEDLRMYSCTTTKPTHNIISTVLYSLTSVCVSVHWYGYNVCYIHTNNVGRFTFYINSCYYMMYLLCTTVYVVDMLYMDIQGLYTYTYYAHTHTHTHTCSTCTLYVEVFAYNTMS